MKKAELNFKREKINIDKYDFEILVLIFQIVYIFLENIHIF